MQIVDPLEMIEVEQEQNALLVPDTSLGSDQSGRYVLVVTKDNTIEQRKVQTGPLEGTLRVIEDGLKADDRVVIAGLLRAIPGQKVEPQMQKIDEPKAADAPKADAPKADAPKVDASKASK